MSKETIYRHLREFRDTFREGFGSGTETMRWPEISQGQIVMMMSPKMQHQRVGNRLRDQLTAQLPADLVVMVETDLEDPGLGILRVPDLAVIDRAHEESGADAIAPAHCHLIIEIVSRSNPANDYEGKLRDYPAMGIPHYVIVDPRDGTAVHHWAPTTRTGAPTYDNQQHFTFGDTLVVQGWKIDTSALPRYGDEAGE
ncbi:Uma2 family endonuclease [Streptomyces sp. NPDC050085]|uniref:Uma2 family endonuclease n=1 Tax=Streptomyces sp. NPDC050085 TaxID=3365600 RepID=UPI0037A81502